MSRRDAEKIELAVTLVHESDRAVLVNDGDREAWLPKSQCEVEGGEYPAPGEAFTLYVAEWVAKEKGLI